MNTNELKDKGWFQTRISNGVNFHNALLECAMEFGDPVRGRKSENVIQRLVPISKASAHPSSLSSMHETGEFPLHVDTAHWITPCRYLVLGCMDEGESIRPTTLLDFNSLQLTEVESDYLHNSPYIVKNGRNSFYGNILSKERKYIRFDSGCMVPANNGVCKMRELLFSKRVRESLTEIYWEKGMILVIDNWRIMHGRGKPMKNGRDRELYRVLVS